MKNQKSIRQLADKNQKFQSGQIVLILVLVTVVGLTIGLSLISRTVTDVRISSQIAESGRAFSAAEAGVESALKGAVAGGPTGSVNLQGAKASYTVQAQGGSSSAYSFPLTEVNKTQTVWLIAHNTDDITLNESGSSYPPTASFDLCWGVDSNNTAAVVLTLYYKLSGSYKIAKGAYDSIAGRGNNFSVTSDTVGGYCGSAYQFKKTVTGTTDFGIDSASTLLALRIQPVYQSTILAIKPNSGSLPLQGKLITAVGQTDTGVVRRIQVNQGFPVLPTLLDFSLFTEN